MSSPISAELPPLPTPVQIAELANTLDRGFKDAEDSAKALKAQLIKAKLQAMRLAPIPANAREALARAAEARRLALEAKAAGSPLTQVEVDQAVAAAREVAAKGRRAVKPGSREDLILLEMQTGPMEGVGVSV
jgi:hypothetical protein